MSRKAKRALKILGRLAFVEGSIASAVYDATALTEPAGL